MDINLSIEQSKEYVVATTTNEVNITLEGSVLVATIESIPAHTHNIDDITATVLQLNEFNNTLYS